MKNSSLYNILCTALIVMPLIGMEQSYQPSHEAFHHRLQLWWTRSTDTSSGLRNESKTPPPHSPLRIMSKPPRHPHAAAWNTYAAKHTISSSPTNHYEQLIKMVTLPSKNRYPNNAHATFAHHLSSVQEEKYNDDQDGLKFSYETDSLARSRDGFHIFCDARLKDHLKINRRLSKAIATGNLKKVKKILDNERTASPNAVEHPQYGKTLFTKAIECRFKAVRPQEKETSLEIIMLLMIHKANVNTKDRTGTTVLMLAARHNDLELAELLKKKHALDIDAVNVFDQTAYDIANDNLSADVKQWLEQHLAQKQYRREQHFVHQEKLRIKIPEDQDNDIDHES